MRLILALSAAAALLAGCEGHQYEPKEPGISLSGEVGAGLKYEEGKGTSVATKSDLTLSLGGSI